MAIIRDPISFSTYYKVDSTILEKNDVLDSVLNVDTKLFIDPLLFSQSKHPEFNKSAAQTYNDFFTNIIKLLEASKTEDDLAWRNAYRIFNFPEISGTCLGYGAASIHGSAWGPKLRKRVLSTAKEIVELGIKDPDLFMALALFEEDVGPDRISDMVTNIVIKDLISFNQRILKSLSVPLTSFNLKELSVNLPVNPLEKKLSPVILVPLDVLRELPIATDFSEVGRAANENQKTRDAVNKHLGAIWETKTRKDKQKVKDDALSSSEAFSSLLDALSKTEKKPYDTNKDVEGQLAWVKILKSISHDFPLKFSLKATPTIDDVFNVVMQIVDQFTSLIENNGLWKELWADDKPRREASAQRIFFAIADSYCKANNVDITPEANSGNGPVDFKFACSYETRVLVEVKLSTNTSLITGYTNQLEIYKKAEKTTRAIYLVIDVGNLGDKDKRLLELKNDAIKNKSPASDIVFVDGTQKESASKRK